MLIHVSKGAQGDAQESGYFITIASSSVFLRLFGAKLSHGPMLTYCQLTGGTNFDEILFEIQAFHIAGFENVCSKMSAIWLNLNVLW